MKEYLMNIGLEVHVELSTDTKIFCACKTAFGERPNTNICPMCTGMPGALPVLNENVVKYAIKLAKATNSHINEVCTFDRKNYYYPDNPKNYQISQLYVPFCREGYVEIGSGDASKRIGIAEIHMEDDAGKLIHDVLENKTLIDYNRAGVPLLEIVTKPDMENADEVIEFLEELRLMIEYLKISDCRLEEGSMRVDVNLSVRHEGEALGCRTEMKNLNSFASIRRAIAHERNRQEKLLLEGKEVELLTLRWDDNNNTSYVMRSKEERADYRYFPEPDLGILVITDKMLNNIEHVRFRKERVSEYVNHGVDLEVAKILTSSIYIAEFFEDVAGKTNDYTESAKWVSGEYMRLKRELGNDFAPDSDVLSKLITLYRDNKISKATASLVFEKYCREGIDIDTFLRDNNLFLVDANKQEEIIRQVAELVIKENPESVRDYKSGREKALGYLVGQVMKRNKGGLDARIVNRIIKQMVDETKV